MPGRVEAVARLDLRVCRFVANKILEKGKRDLAAQKRHTKGTRLLVMSRLRALSGAASKRGKCWFREKLGVTGG